MMSGSSKYIWREEKPIYGTDIGVSIRANWKRLPPILHKCKQLDLSIQKAKYWDEWTTMYLKRPKTQTSVATFDDVIHGVKTLDMDEIGVLFPQRLPYKTSVYVYNISTAPYTILDFGCLDRCGLFCEILEVLARYDIEVVGAYINTIGNIVSNIFYITHRGMKLDDKYIEYLRNNLELEVRDQDETSY